MILCFATNNVHKLREVSQLVDTRFRILSLEDIGCEEDIPEDQRTIRDNSGAKAEYVFNKYHVNCFADDTGLEVDALGGEPGVFSARYAGPGKNSDDNVTLLLKKLGHRSDRTARFRTIISLILGGQLYQFEGVAEGSITMKRKGTNGFGYDPVFIPQGYDQTFAEMPADRKNEISHRGKAIGKLVGFLNALA